MQPLADSIFPVRRVVVVAERQTAADPFRPMLMRTIRYSNWTVVCTVRTATMDAAHLIVICTQYGR